MSLIPDIWDATPRDFIESRHGHIVNNKSQYCSVVRTGIGKIRLVIGGEVDAGRSIINSEICWAAKSVNAN